MPNWPLLAWRMNATWQARRLARTEPFRVAWTYAVIALDALGDEFVSLEGDEVDRFLADLRTRCLQICRNLRRRSGRARRGNGLDCDRGGRAWCPTPLSPLVFRRRSLDELHVEGV